MEFGDLDSHVDRDDLCVHAYSHRKGTQEQVDPIIVGLIECLIILNRVV